ncbi:MAG: hypothetical protein M3281_00830, partial [Chloroflexota bacterium]|nr:hypothetical protein [Chloroflexota bacterium]
MSVSLQQISPNADGERETTTISVRLSSAAKEKVDITDSEGSQVHLIHDYWSRSAGTYKYVYNGKVKNSAGEWVNLPEGTYYARAMTMGTDGSTATRTAKFYVNNTLRSTSASSTALSYNTYRTLFSPNGDSRKDGVVSRFTLKRPASVRMKIYANGDQVRSISSTFTTSGTKSMTWNGRILSNGSWVWAPAGNYIIRLEALPTDAALASSMGYAYSIRRMTADKSRPSISTSLSRSTITIGSGQTATLSYKLSQSGYRRVTVSSSGGTVVSAAGWAYTGATGSFT